MEIQELKNKLFAAIDDNMNPEAHGRNAATKECAKVSIEFAIAQFQDLRIKWIGVNVDAYHDANNKIAELQKQLSEL